MTALYGRGDLGTGWGLTDFSSIVKISLDNCDGSCQSGENLLGGKEIGEAKTMNSSEAAAGLRS